MELITYTEPEAFLQVVQTQLERREAANSLMLGGVLSLKARSSSASNSLILVSVQDHGAWSLAAVMTPPYPLILATVSSCVPVQELSLLVQHLRLSEVVVSGVVAVPELASAFATLWTSTSGTRIASVVHQRIYSLTRVLALPNVPGQLRRATAADIALVGRWFAEFELEALNENDTGRARERAVKRVDRREVYLWDDSQPRSMAARDRPSRNTITVNEVYTPPAARRQGFATATVAQLSRELLLEGYSTCVLYTDLSNPTSNRIYQRIGYQPVCDSDHIIFDRSLSGI